MFKTENFTVRLFCKEVHVDKTPYLACLQSLIFLLTYSLFQSILVCLFTARLFCKEVRNFLCIAYITSP